MKTVLLALTIVAAVVLPTAQSLRYTAYKTKVSFFEAWQQCIVKGGSLVSIELASQNSMVLREIKKAGGDSEWWLSGTDVGLEGSWIWFSRNTPVGSPFGFLNFGSGEPNNAGSNGEHCLAINSLGKWNDVSCDKLLYYVCEFYSR